MRNVGMIQRGKNLCLALTSRKPAGVIHEWWREHFQRDVTIQLAISRSKHDSHPTRAQTRHDFIFRR